MLILALALAAGVPGGQILAGPSFDPFARRVDRSCPARSLRAITPGDLDWLEESFAAALAPSARRRLAVARGPDDGCVAPGGLSCPANAMLGAIEHAGLLRSFVGFACTHPVPR